MKFNKTIEKTRHHQPILLCSTVYNNWDIVCVGVYERVAMFGHECGYSSHTRTSVAIKRFLKKNNPVMSIALQPPSFASQVEPAGTIINDNRDFATGHLSGEIIVWYGGVDSVYKTFQVDAMSSTVCSTLHWHAHPVLALSYSSSYSSTSKFLFSGGEEAVLCTWGVEGTADRNLREEVESGAVSTDGGTQSARPTPVQFIPRIALGGIVSICVEKVSERSAEREAPNEKMSAHGENQALSAKSITQGNCAKKELAILLALRGVA